MNIEDTALDKIRKVNIVEIINLYVKLQKKGNSYLGLCPFHNEKTPSFNVSENKGFFHCFGCHESGDAISFLMKIDQLSFIQAVEKIANVAGITIEQFSNTTKNKDLFERSKQIISQFKVSAEHILSNQDHIIKYLKQRGLKSELIKKFSLGFVNNQLTMNEFESKGFSKKEILDAGVFSQFENKIKSRFINRLLFPITNHLGQCVGFSGRILDNNKNYAKYINSSDSKLFNKGQILYGLDKAKHVIKKLNKAILVEGYMDVILCHQSNILNTVGVMGTALTQFQCQLLSRYTNEVILLFDSDEAGKAAIDKSYYNLCIYGIKTYVLTLSDKDPAEYLLNNSAQDFNTQLGLAKTYLNFKIEQFLKKFDSDNYKIVNILELIKPIVNAEKNEIIKHTYIEFISQKLNVEKYLVEKVMKLKKNIVQNHFLKPSNVKTKYEKAAQYLLSEMANSLQNKEYILKKISVEDFVKVEFINVAKELNQHTQINGHILQRIKNNETKKVLSRIILEESYNDLFNIDEALKILVEYKYSVNKKNYFNKIKNEKNIDHKEIDMLFNSIIQKGGSVDGKT